MSEPLVLPGCEAAQPDLNAYVDGELGPDEHAELERHLANCAACQTETDLLRLVRQSLQQAPRPVPPDAMRQRLLAQVIAELPPQRRDVLCIERHGDRVIQRREVRISREPGILPRLRPAPAVPASPVIQQCRRVLSNRPNCYQVFESYHERD